MGGYYSSPCMGAHICGATKLSASLIRGTSRCHKVQGKFYSTAKLHLAEQIPLTLQQGGCPFHADHSQDIF